MLCVKNIVEHVTEKQGIREVNHLPSWLEQGLLRVVQQQGEVGFRVLLETAGLKEGWFKHFLEKCRGLRVEGYAK